jgi:hypothetical protein
MSSQRYLEKGLPDGIIPKVWPWPYISLHSTPEVG